MSVLNRTHGQAQYVAARLQRSMLAEAEMVRGLQFA